MAVVAAPSLSAPAEDGTVITVKPAKLTAPKKAAFAWIDNALADLARLNDRIWSAAELALRETKSAELLASYLESQGFQVECSVAGLPTAFVATWGTGTPVIGVLGEYDALPGLSQQAVPSKTPAVEGDPGHGCGHNIFGVASAGAAAALKHAMKKAKIPGTVKYFGCPAEETVTGKVFMARAGVFDGLSCCLQWHPGDENAVSLDSSNALNQFEAEFFGRSAHAAGDPWHGRSALDGIELANVGLNYLREHLKPTARIHYVILDGGGAPNVVPDHARAWYYVRNLDRPSVEEDYARVLEVLEGAAKMSGTTYKIRFLSGVHEVLPNRAGAEVVYANLLLVGGPAFSAEEQAFARAIQKNLGLPEKGLKTEIEPFREPEKSWGSGSTDVAEVSWLTPTTALSVTCGPDGTPWHHWSVVACAGTTIAHKSLQTAAKVMAAAGLDILGDPALLKAMRDEWLSKTKGKPYVSPLPPDVLPPVGKK
ncbi:MAG: amidohydrolase [Candidatus Aminicenantes bacterium]|nr:amidohydrolase [Candidatus Aminicenantes bacterium]